jgi:hypothetical protein
VSRAALLCALVALAGCRETGVVLELTLDPGCVDDGGGLARVVFEVTLTPGGARQDEKTAAELFGAGAPSRVVMLLPDDTTHAVVLARALDASSLELGRGTVEVPLGKGRVTRDLVLTGSCSPPDLGGDDAADLSMPSDLGDAQPPADMGGCGVLQLSGDGANAPARSEYNVSSFTLEAWLRPDGPALTGNKNVLGHWGVHSANTGSYALYLADGVPRLAISCNGGVGSFQTTAAATALTAGVWTHVAVVFNSATMQGRVYLNGVQSGAGGGFGCATPHPTSGVPFQISYDDPEGGDHYTGLLDEARLSSVVRYTGSFTPSRGLTPDADTVVLYHFEDPGPNLDDASPLMNHSVPEGAGAARTVTTCY